MKIETIDINGKIHIYPDRTELVKRDWQAKQVWYPEEITVEILGVVVPIAQLVELYRKQRGWTYDHLIIAEIDYPKK